MINYNYFIKNRNNTQIATTPTGGAIDADHWQELEASITALIARMVGGAG
jgi:hypothetical protein